MNKTNLSFLNVIAAPFMLFFIGLLIGACVGGIHSGYKLFMLLIQQSTGMV